MQIKMQCVLVNENESFIFQVKYMETLSGHYQDHVLN